ncbi:ComF family protein [bacterium]|nr:ComF family protein [bacterium]
MILFWPKMFSKIVSGFLEIFFPFSCHVCRSASSFGIVICEKCKERLEAQISEPFRITDVSSRCPIWSLGIYEDVLSKVIKSIKYKPSLKLISEIFPRVQAVLTLQRVLEFPDVVVPVPLHFKRERKRGFNQAFLLGEMISKTCGASFSPILQRIRETTPQADCDENQRATNLLGAFSLAEGVISSIFRGKKIWLVDDVSTTGATMDNCAEVLLPLKLSSLNAIVLAHSPKVFGARL